jgi:LPXTG-site transpeptidase (sortase) family protein
VRPILDLRVRGGPASSATAVVGILAAAVALAASGVVTAVVRGTDGSAPPSLVPVAPPAVGAATARSAPAITSAGDPVRVRIPAIGVDAPLVRLGLDGGGALQVPRYEEAGWYAGGSRPGEIGPSVIAAHVDSTTGPAVFYRLDDLEPGDEVFVDYRGATVGFTVREARSVTKTRFPTDQVYGATAAPELRLVTCAGAFDRRTRNYAANLIVWADLLDTA